MFKDKIFEPAYTISVLNLNKNEENRMRMKKYVRFCCYYK